VARVTMYSRERCGLCDDAREVILAARARAPFEYEEVFIDGDPGLERAYGIRVPVVAVDGHEAFELTVDPGALLDAVRGAGGPHRDAPDARDGRLRD
jgi:glutaredoxin